MAGRKAQIVDAALAVAQERGLAAMTMRSVAEHLGSSVMGLYRHVATKEDLLDELVGRLLAEVEQANPNQPWQQRLHHLADELLALAVRYPSVLPLLMTRAYVSPAAVEVVVSTSAMLREAGVPADQVPRMERLIATFLLGYATSVANRAFWSDPSATTPSSELPIEPAPGLPTAADEDRTMQVWRTELSQDVEDLITLIATVALG